MPGKRSLQILNVLGFALMVFVNYAAVTLPLNNMSTGEISELYPSLFTPAGFTFSIWGLIYLLLASFCLYQARDLFRSQKKEMHFLNSIGWLFFISSLLNAGWIFAWHYLQLLSSMLIMVSLLLVLIRIYLNLSRETISRAEALWVYLPFRAYLGWITIATIANASALLVDLGWDRFGLSETFWTVAVIAAATTITLAFLKIRRDLAVGLVSVWALFGIAAKRWSEEPVFMTVVVSAVAAMVIIVAFALWIWAQGHSRSSATPRA